MRESAPGWRRSSVANKKRRARSGRARAASSVQPAQQNQASASQRTTSMFKSTMRLVALLSATMLAVLVFELLQGSLGLWPALGIAFGVGVVARLLFIWLERLWLGAAARRAIAQEARRTGQ
jgi:hypothetical protein